jgi:hypothetical protein
MELSKYREDAHEFTAKLSDINRNLAFAGIAIIWVFKVQADDKFIIPNELLLPLYFIVICLLLDLLQYLYLSIIWTLFHRKMENKKIKETKAPKWYSNVSYVILFTKVAVNIIGFVFLFIYLSNELFLKT